MPRALMSCLGVPESVQKARAFVVSTLAGWDADEYEWPALLVVSELATNAVLHAQTAYEVHLILEPDSLSIEVRDGSVLTPGRRRYADDATTGRGMRLVTDVSTGWDVEVVQTGKIVRCALPRAGQPRRDTNQDGDDGRDLDDRGDLDALLARFPDDDAGAAGAQVRSAGRGRQAA